MAMQIREDQDQVVYPETDGKPMAENTLQYEWITTIKGNLDIVFRGDPNVFVAGDLFWYPVKGRPDIRAAPDVLVACGRPAGHRRSYLQWREEVAPHVVFEILSPGNRPEEMDQKFEFYDHYGVEEYYIYDPEIAETAGWRRLEGRLQPILPMHGWTSPRLGVRFDLSGEELVLYRPDGTRFLTVLELDQGLQEAVRRAEEEARQRELVQRRMEKERRRADKAARREEEERRRADEEHQARRQEHERAERLAAMLRKLGVDPEKRSE